MSFIETYRGTVHRWEVDNVDHFTLAYYFARFDDAMLASCMRLPSTRSYFIERARHARRSRDA